MAYVAVTKDERNADIGLFTSPSSNIEANMIVSLIYPYDRRTDTSFRWGQSTDAKDFLPSSFLDSGGDISIVLPMYNVRPYLKRCLDSVFSQIDITIQVILVNDGSTDGSLELAIDYLRAVNCKNAIIVDQENRGLSAARNIGARVAQCDYLAFLDTDDFMAPCAYARMLHLAESEQLDVALCRSMVYDNNTLRFSDFYDSPIWEALLQNRPHLITDSVMTPQLFKLEPNANPRLIRRSFFLERNLFYPEGLLFEDLPIHVKSIANARKIGLINSKSYMYRINRPGKITEQKSRRRFDVLRIFQQTLDTALAHSLTEQQAACIVYAMTRISFWCGRETHLTDRKAFLSNLSKQYETLPKHWVDAFAAWHRQDIYSLVKFYALSEKNITYVYRISLGMKPLLRTALLFVKQRRYGLILFQTYLYLKANAKRFMPVKASGTKSGNSSPLGMDEKCEGSGCMAADGQENLIAGLQKDIDCLKNSIFSHQLFCPSKKPIVLDIGARSGLFAAHFASYHSTIQVFVVAGRQALFEASDQFTRHNSYANIHSFDSVDHALSKAAAMCQGTKMRIDLVRIGKTAQTLQILKRMSDHFCIGHLCGEFNEREVSAVELFRLSAAVAESFMWQNCSRHMGMSGYGRENVDVSIVVPVFNVEAYLPACIESLVKQTLKSKEILLVDDGSTDSSGDICDQFAQLYPEIRVIHKQNAGCAAARSTGLAAATGMFVGFVDSDDWVDATMFEKLFDAAVTSNVEVAQCGFQKVYMRDQVVEPYREEFRFSWTYDACGIIDDAKRLMHSMPSIWRRIYKTDFLRGKGIDFVHELPRFDDLPFQFEVFMHGPKIAIIEGYYYNYRLDRIGQDVSVRDERLFVHFTIFQYLRKRVALNPHIDWERELKKVELSTHAWGLSLIEDRLKRKYLYRVAQDIFGRRLFITCSTILKEAFDLSIPLGRFGLMTYIRYLFLSGKKIWRKKSP